MADMREEAWGEGYGEGNGYERTGEGSGGDGSGYEGKGSVWDQYKALVIRNFIIKKRDKRRTITEFVMPVYFIVILALIRLGIKDTQYDAVLEPHGQAQLLTSLFFLYNTTLHITPDTAQVQRIMSSVQDMADDIDIYTQYYPSEDNITLAFNNDMKIAIVFDEDNINNYKLRFNPRTTQIPSPTSLKSGGAECRYDAGLSLQNGGCSTNGYYYSGFSALQTLIDMAIIKENTATDTVPTPNILVQNMPRDEYESNGGMVLRNIVPLYMVFAWAQFIVYMLMLVVEEKEKKIKESMKMMGLRDAVYWLSWFTVYGAYVLVLALICIILLPLAGVFRKANVFLLFILFILYGCSSIMFSFMLTPFFNKAKVAGVAGNLIQVALSLLFYLQVYLGTDLDAWIFWVLALLSPCAFSMAIDKTIMFDYSDVGLSYERLWDGPGLPFAGSLIMISVDIFIYLFLAYYLDNVIPSEYGTKRKPYFLFQKSFWTGKSNSFKFVNINSVENKGYDQNSDIMDSPDDAENSNITDIEPVAPNLKSKIAVKIRNLRKTYHARGKDPVHAVDGFSLDIYEGQITAILGHNGAGKTTLFNVLTGMTSLTQGAASIFGMDITDPNDLTELRRITGVCPQHDVIFMKLTPLEHLTFFAQIRGVPADKISSMVEQTLKEVDLYSKKSSLAMDLSGGQKRKLSIGIAIIGDPKIIFLDEPTAGVDAYSRRKLWGLLKNRKEGKVILLTTHFMDEADILADRKAIMSQGKLRCCGSSLFLKNKFGLGYHLTLVVREDVIPDTIKNELQKIITDVQIIRFYGKEMSLLLPSNSAGQFPKLFEQLDKYINAEDNFGIEGYGISMTTLEEVFLSLSEENEGGEMKSIDRLGEDMIRSQSSSPTHQSIQTHKDDEAKKADISGFAIHEVEVKRNAWRAFKSLMWVRTMGVFREPAAMFFLIVFPLAFTIGSIALADSQKIPIATDKHLVLNTDMYKNIPGALIYNDTKHTLQYIENTLSASNLTVSNYSGDYYELSQNWNHFSAFDVFSFIQTSAAILDTNMTMVFNDTYIHSIPILINIINNAIYTTMGGAGNINISTQVLPATSNAINFDTSSFFAPMMIGFTFTLVPAGLTMDLVLDRETKIRSMLRLNGVGFNVYFSSYLVVMIILYMISYVGLLIIIQAFNVTSLTIPPAYTSIALLYFLYMPCAMFSNAAASYIFDKSETARQFYPSMVTTLGFIAYTVVSMVDIFTGSDTAQIIHIVFTVLCPVYIPFGLLYYINKIYIDCSIYANCDDLTANDYMTTEIIVLYVVLILDIPLYYLILRVADTVKLGGSWREALWLQKPKMKPWEEEDGVDGADGEDDDVVRERNNVSSSLQDPTCTSPVLIYDLGMKYKQTVNDDEKRNPCKRGEESIFVALKSVSMEVKSGQVFGLLGPNGAGKTTTLRIMTAEERPSKGRVQICSEDIVSSMSKVFETMGYCPQHDSLWRNITLAEHIQCYADIRGVREDQVEHLVNAYVKGLEVEEHRDKKSKDCSGGTKRKLSYIMSMLGQPQVVLLDEPSTGMDPKSKRFLWNSILASFRGQRSAILTTHSMEEADALCSTIGILVRGGMRCIGPIQHLKNKYGGGYSLEVKLKPQHRPSISLSDIQNSTQPSPTINKKIKIKEIIIDTFPNAILDEEFDERLIYKIVQNDVRSLAQCFEMLENAKGDGLIEEYALSQTTLEQVFIQFARAQQEEDQEQEEQE